MSGISGVPMALTRFMAVAVTMLGTRGFFGFVRGNFLRIMAGQKWEDAGKNLPLPLSRLGIVGIGLMVDSAKYSDKIVHLPLNAPTVIGGEVG